MPIPAPGAAASPKANLPPPPGDKLSAFAGTYSPRALGLSAGCAPRGTPRTWWSQIGWPRLHWRRLLLAEVRLKMLVCGWPPCRAMPRAWTQGPPPPPAPWAQGTFSGVACGRCSGSCSQPCADLCRPLHVSRPLCSLHVRAAPGCLWTQRGSAPPVGGPGPAADPPCIVGGARGPSYFMAPPRPLPVTAPALLLCGFSLGPGSLLCW